MTETIPKFEVPVAFIGYTPTGRCKMTTLRFFFPNNDGRMEVLNPEFLGNLFSKPCLHLLCGG